MDAPDQDPGELRGALRFLAWVNRAFGGRRLVAGAARPGRVLDLATGAGDVPAYLLARGVARFAVGVDRGAQVLRAAGEMSPEVVRMRADALRLPFADQAFDTAVSHLFFHHLDEDQAVAVLQGMARVARRVVVVDLARRRRLWVMVWLLTHLFTRNRVARHDGLVSVERAWTPSEAAALAARAGLKARVRTRILDRWELVADTD